MPVTALHRVESSITDLGGNEGGAAMALGRASSAPFAVRMATRFTASGWVREALAMSMVARSHEPELATVA